jgi:trehalose 6-phosphate synthase/phosphatase
MSHLPDSYVIREAYKKSRNRIFFLDYDGTLVPFHDKPEDSILEEQTRTVLHALSSTTENRIYIISGRNKEFLDLQFRDFPIGLIAEHGFLRKEVNSEWVRLRHIQTPWKNSVAACLSGMADMHAGTFIEEKESSVVFHFRTAEKNAADKIRKEIREMAARFRILFPTMELLDGNNVIEFKPGEFNKGQIAKSIVDGGSYDFILAAGDDVTDESVFQQLNHSAFTIKIGSDATSARYTIGSQEEFVRFLIELWVTP